MSSIKNGSIAVSDLSDDAQEGMQGVPGPAGVPGVPGAAGAPGLAGIVTVESIHFNVAPGGYSPVTANAYCPPGKVVIGSGFYGSIAHVGFVKAYTTFVGGFIFNDASVTATDLHFQATCASPSGAVASAVSKGSSAFHSDWAAAKALVK